MRRAVALARVRHISLPGPHDIYRKVLSNGIAVLVRSNFNSPAVAVRGYVRAGSTLDPDGMLGLADFTAAALMRGTSRHSFDALYNDLESVGAALGFDAGMESTGFHGHALSEDFPRLCGLLAETLLEPTFPAVEIEKLRHQLLTGLAIRMQDTADMADLTFDSILYRGHPYSRPEEGNPETIGAITRGDLRRYHRETYGPRGMAIAIVGAVDVKRAVEGIRRVLGSWKNPDQKLPPVVADPRRVRTVVRRHHRIAGKSQSDVILGTNGPRRADPEFHAASLGNSILGQFGMMGRIGKAVRQESGLAYYAYSQLNGGLGPGSWTVGAGVNPANLKQAEEIIVEQLRKFIKGGVSRDELRDVQSNFVGRLPLSLESNAGVASALLSIERYNLGLDYYQRYAGLIHSVTPADVLQAARKFIDPDRLVIATAGP